MIHKITTDKISFEIEKGTETFYCAIALPKNSQITPTEAQKLFEKVITKQGAKLIQCKVAENVEETKESFSKDNIPLASDHKSVKKIAEKTLNI